MPECCRAWPDARAVAHLRAVAFPFCGQLERNTFHNAFCFVCQHSVAGHNEGGEVSSLVVTGLGALLFLVLLVVLKGAFCCMASVRCVVGMCCSDVHDAVAGFGLEASCQDVASVFVSFLGCFDVRLLRFGLLFFAATLVNLRFVANRRRVEGLFTQVCELVLDFVVMENNEPTVFALE